MTTESKKYLDKKSLIILILSLLLVGIGGFLLYDYKVAQIEEEYAPELIVIHDTIIRDSIQIQEKIVTRYITKDQIKFDTVVQIDSIRDTLTIYVPIPIEHKSYRDFQLTDTAQWELRINYSGYKPSLDSVWFHYSYIPKEVVKTKENAFRQFVGVSVNVGYGATINTTDRTFVPGPYIGVGISYGWGWTFK